MRGECRHFASAFARYVYVILKIFASFSTLEGTGSIICSNIQTNSLNESTFAFYPFYNCLIKKYLLK